MNIHYLQHVPFEGLGSMEQQLLDRQCSISSTQLYNNSDFPGLDRFDCLIVMGGPMGIFDDEQYPWLSTEKKFIQQAIHAKKTIIGVCLGAQLLADAFGAKVYKNEHREIGWHSIIPTKDLSNTVLDKAIPAPSEVFHWHGDTFDIPENGVRIASSEACQNQGFIIDDRIIGLQFHLETTTQSASDLIHHCGDEIDGSKYVQSKEAMMDQPERFQQINCLMSTILDRLLA